MLQACMLSLALYLELEVPGVVVQVGKLIELEAREDQPQLLDLCRVEGGC